MTTLTIEAASVTQAELTQLEDMATHLGTDSRLSTYVRGVVAELRCGMDLTTLETEAALSPAAAAKFLKMSRTFLMHYIKNGELKATMKGSHHVIAVQDLVEFRERVLLGRETTAHALGNATSVATQAQQTALARARAARLARLDED